MAQTDTLPNFDKLWNYVDPASTGAKFRELLPEAERSGNTDYFAQLLTQVARTESLQGHFSESDSILDRAEKVLTPQTPVARARYLLERGRIQNSSGHPDKSIPFFREAYDVAKAAGSMRHAIDALHMLGIAAATPKEQVEWNLKGIAEVAAHPDEKGWLWALYNNIGESYAKIPDYAKAREYFAKLAEYQKERQGEADMYTLKDLAKMDRLSGHPEASRSAMQPILDTLLAQGKDDGYIRAELADALESLGRHQEAHPHFAKAYELLSVDEWFKQNEPQNLERYARLGGVVTK
jgi:tetratricopeptide (TPR) repeat protein